MLEIDGSYGEGGGQILRSALAASLLTGTPFRLVRIRAGRQRPGLRPQHLAAVRAAAEVSHAEVSGAHLGSQQLTFRPGQVRPGRYRFDIGTAGSATLVAQTVLLPLALAGPSTVEVIGGTHNEQAPPAEFLARAYAGCLRRMGVEVEVELLRCGFYPAGGGRIRCRTGAVSWRPLELTDRGSVQRVEVVALLARLPRHIAERELAVVRRELTPRRELAPGRGPDPRPEVAPRRPAPRRGPAPAPPFERAAPSDGVSPRGDRPDAADELRAGPATDAREVEALSEPLGGAPVELRTEVVPADGPGNAVLVTVVCEEVTEVFSAVGRRGKPAEAVAAEAAAAARRYLESDAAVGPWLADQLLLPMILAGGGRFTTTEATRHLRTNVWVLERFFPHVGFEVVEAAEGRVEVGCAGR